MSYAEIKYTVPPKAGEPDTLPSLEAMRQTAKAAGHGRGGSLATHPHMSTGENPWFNLEDNCRPVYDIRFIQLFNPDVVDHLLGRLEQAERTASPVEQLEAWRAAGEQRQWRVRTNDSGDVEVALFHGSHRYAAGTGQDVASAATDVLAQIANDAN